MATNRQGKIHIVEDNIDITGENYGGKLVDFTIEDNCYVNDKFIGTTVAKKITVNIINPNNEINLENKEIQAYAGINNELVPFGSFIIQKPDNQEVKEKTSFTGYDYMIKFNTPYTDKGTYPIKTNLLFQNLCEQVGLEVGNMDFTNCDYMILGNPFTNNEDCRTVLSNIAQLAGGFAHIGRDNKVYIVSLKNISNLLKVKDVHNVTVEELNLIPIYLSSGGKEVSDEYLNGHNYLDNFSKNEQWGEVNSLIIRLSDIEGENTTKEDSDSINENGLTEITIADNYFLLDQTEREKVIGPLWNILKGIKYLPFKTSYYGYPYLDVGDIIYVEDINDNGYISYVFNHTFTFNGAFTGSIETPALTKTQTAYKNTTDIKTKFKQAERRIDKINGIIEDIIEETDENSEKLSQHEQTIDSISDTVSSVETKIETVETKADNAQTTANTANTNAQNAQKTADENTTKITTTTAKLTEVEQTVDGISQSVSAVEEKVETVESTANTAKNTADNINTNLATNYYTKTETNSQINQKADSITSSVSKTYSTKTETANAKNEAINSANASTNEKLKDYSTTEQMNSVITQKANEITNTVSSTYATKTELTTAKSEIKQTTDSITSTVSKKVGNDEIISKINQSAEAVGIDSNKIELSASDVLNLLAGNTINLSGKNIKISSNNFNVDENGNMACSNADITGGKLQLTSTTKNPKIIIGGSESNNAYENYLYSGGMKVKKDNNVLIDLFNVTDGSNSWGGLSLKDYNGTSSTNIDYNFIYSAMIKTDNLIQSSLAEKKKNFEKLQNNAIDILKQIDIYKYNLKSEKDTDKKHIGFVIGDNYNYSKEATNNDNTGVDNYSFTSLCCKAIQEQQEQIEILQEKDKQKDEMIADLIKRLETLEKEVNK